jgi:hypothetical protein
VEGILLCLWSLLPNPELIDEPVDVLELNTVVQYASTYDPLRKEWEHKCTEHTYWFGRNWRELKPGVGDEVLVVDWWERYGGESVQRMPDGRWFVLIRGRDNSYHKIVSHVFDRSWTQYDDEVGQRKLFLREHHSDFQKFRRKMLSPTEVKRLLQSLAEKGADG